MLEDRLNCLYPPTTVGPINITILLEEGRNSQTFNPALTQAMIGCATCILHHRERSPSCQGIQGPRTESLGKAQLTIPEKPTEEEMGILLEGKCATSRNIAATMLGLLKS